VRTAAGDDDGTVSKALILGERCDVSHRYSLANEYCRECRFGI
jgi:hypothetical protein